ncbi:peptidase [Betaproteobacteria bacterium SCN1]|jgi:putative proteasome-type protease|nr:peptidase [Betaproteobacteria bacterium SCN1]MBN8760181.1 peptidase [Thiobacillus sp.]ODU87809.1 MAG: peptidase [Thiobacillus sp. SCN 65-179]OJW39470.1 MAG: peptidase [Thiobacillus sp. 65-69]
MTYCVAIKTDSGLVFASDSLTNAGIDHVSSYSKMHTFVLPGNRMFVLLAAGNLATTQAVVKQLQDDCRLGNLPCLNSLGSMSEAADHVGSVSTAVQRAQAARDTANTNFEATFIFGGQIAGQTPEMYLIYPQGNHIHESATHPFLQIGETKYGKPILDRVIRSDTPLEQAARCALVSINSTIRSNLTVGPPVELLLYTANSLDGGRHLLLGEDHPYYRALGDAWNEGLRQALNNLPAFEWEGQPQPLQVVASGSGGQMQG